MAINFPDSPVADQVSTQNGRSWKFNGSAWEAYAGETLLGPQGEPGPKGDIGLQGFVGETGVIQETQTWEDANYNFDQDYNNDTGAPLDIRLYVQNDNSAAGNSDISVYARINNAINISFVESFKLAGAGAHDDVGNITIPIGATFKFFGVTGDGSISNLVWKRMVRTQVIVEQQTPSVTGTATFTNNNNRISLAGVGSLFGLYVGDVIQVTGSTVTGNITDGITNNNNKVFTVTDIVDANTIEVNDFHQGSQAEYYNHSLVDETETVTVALVCKAKNASLGYGQSWTVAGVFTSYGVVSVNSTGRTIGAIAYANTLSGTSGSNSISARINGTIVAANTAGTSSTGLGNRASVYLNIPNGSTYQFDHFSLASHEKFLYQLR